MRRSGAILLLMVGVLAAPALAKSKKKDRLPQLFCQARYVSVETTDGSVFSPNILPIERDEAADLQQRLEDWKRYVLVYRRSESDLIFVVRTGRTSSTGVMVPQPRDPNATAQYPPGGGRNGRPNQYPGSIGEPGEPGDPQMSPGDPQGRPGVGTEMGPSDDLLAIYTGAQDNKLHMMLWRHTEDGGLAEPNMPLFQQIRSAVDEACKDQPAKQEKP